MTNGVLIDFDFDESRLVIAYFKDGHMYFEVRSLTTGEMWYSLSSHQDPRLRERLSHTRLISYSNGMFRIFTGVITATRLPLSVGAAVNELDVVLGNFESVLR